MSSISVILEPDANGTVHLHLPPELSRGKLRVDATPLAEEQTIEPLSPEEHAHLLRTLEELRARSALQRRELSAEEQEQRCQAALAAFSELRAINPE